MIIHQIRKICYNLPVHLYHCIIYVAESFTFIHNLPNKVILSDLFILFSFRYTLYIQATFILKMIRKDNESSFKRFQKNQSVILNYIYITHTLGIQKKKLQQNDKTCKVKISFFEFLMLHWLVRTLDSDQR